MGRLERLFWVCFGVGVMLAFLVADIIQHSINLYKAKKAP